MFRKTLAILVFVLLLPAFGHAWYVNAKTSPAEGQGTITPSGNVSYPNGADSAEYTVTPAPGSGVARVTIDGIAALPNARGTYVVPYVAGKSWRYIVAYFQANSISITLSGGGATGALRERDGLPLTNIPVGSTRTLLIQPASGYAIDTYTATGTPAENVLNADGSRTITYGNLQQNESVSATFAPIPSVVARAGADQVSQGEGAAYAVLLDGSLSSSNQGILTYRWSAPSALVLATPTAATTSAYSESAGTYTATLTVTANGISGSDTAQVTILSAQQATLNACASCHQARDPLVVSAYGESLHLSVRGGASCKDCHDSAANGHYSDPAPVSRCSACHGDGTGHAARPAETCVDCHDPHSLKGAWEEAECTFCHGFPPKSGAHDAHFGLAATAGAYDDVGTLELRFLNTPFEEAPKVYAFGCANCHSVDRTRHMNGSVDVLLHEEDAPPGSLKGRAAAGASFDPLARTCSGVYCHSSGQAEPAYRTTPPWHSSARLACDGCHGNPPAYPSGGAGTATANSHIGLSSDGHEWGHFLGLPGPWMTSRHGGNYRPTDDAAPITCQACHYETTDPANTGPSGFYYLDTTGTYALPGGDPARTVPPFGHEISWQERQQCGHCHKAGGAPVGSGKVLPLRHVNGTRDVHFDPRDTSVRVTTVSGVDFAYPYWMSGSRGEKRWPAGVTRVGSTVSFSLKGITYDPQSKSCFNTACHLADTNPVWGRPLVIEKSAACFVCHAGK